ncbi:alpha/beta fold hydrolase [Neobacillus niacini]|uniref:alpha/beta fold hydrolase n=1 Tax=Neobacillus niacini TaxID=86668 RepID=UPI0021CB78BD|nr:alpha/beta hydrolase [Neobacillus niacini]MCM3765166.1 alpha/beta hydrolase [Neobacillus niacini]
MLTRKTKKIQSNYESVATLEEVTIGGIKQWVLIRGENVDNPLMLFLHGGPGTAQIGFAPKFQRDLEKDFVVVNWDQRGAGITYSPATQKEELTIETHLNDTIELIQYLLKRFNKSKLILVGHSWGTVLGTLTAQKYPQYIFCYIGIGQVVKMQEGEKVSYEFTLNKATESKNQKAIKQLHNVKDTSNYMNYLEVQRKWLTKLGGSYIGINDYQLIYSNMLFATEYTLKDWFTYMKAGKQCLEALWPEVLTVDLFANVTKLDVPVYIFAGRQDYQTPSQVAKKYFDLLECPHKEFVWFEHSAHLLNFEEPEKFYQECLKIKRQLA